MLDCGVKRNQREDAQTLVKTHRDPFLVGTWSRFFVFCFASNIPVILLPISFWLGRPRQLSGRGLKEGSVLLGLLGISLGLISSWFPFKTTRQAVHNFGKIRL